MALTINRQKRAAVETAGFGASAAAGIYAGQAVVTTTAGLGIAVLATPAGWVFIIGAAIVTGYIAAKKGDSAGQWLANQAYDLGSWLSSL